ncbi:MAG: polysialyltransferase family glycosyltransferase [Bacteroidia bacterium]
MIRIFVCPSHLSALYMILYARKTKKPGHKDVLILDWPAKRASLIKVITDTKKIHPWDEIIDLSTTLSDDTDLKPSAKKVLVRKLKENALIKPFYNVLLKKHRAKQAKIEEQKIRNALAGKGAVTEVNILTQTGIIDSLFKLFPKAAVNYFEHGTGDYFLIQKVRTPRFNFYCIFSERFKEYLGKKNLPNNYVKGIIEEGDFLNIANETIAEDEQKNEIISKLKFKGKKVLILMESVEIYNVPDNFWTDYLDLCISNVPDPQNYTFILKPHPAQSFKAMEISKNHLLNHHKVKTVMIENSHSVNYSAEVLYSLWYDSTDYVFTVFSSGLYYISKIYNNKNTKYFHAFDFFRSYTKNSPAQFMYIYNGLEDLVKNVLSENCIDMKNPESTSASH